MMALASSSLSSLFHILPPSRTSGGIDASMMTSDGTWKFVMPLPLSTMATRGRSA